MAEEKERGGTTAETLGGTVIGTMGGTEVGKEEPEEKVEHLDFSETKEETKVKENVIKVGVSIATKSAIKHWSALR